MNRTIAAAVVAMTLLGALVGAFLAQDVRQDDDVLAFLPEGNEDIRTFNAINERFGGLDVALVGISVDDPFDSDFLTRLQKVSEDIRQAGGVERVLSLTSVDDFREDPVMGGIVTSVLVDSIPTSDAEKAALRTKVMSRDHVVGTMISESEDAVLLYVFASPGTAPRDLAARTDERIRAAFPDHQIFWGGAPFISTWIYDTTQQDMARLTPWAVVAIVLIILLSFRDWVGSLLALFTTTLGIVASRAAMAVLDVPFNIVLSSMPVILFAVGSAYSIHMLSRYYANAGPQGDREAALRRTIEETAPVVVAAGLTTVAGLGSFVMMDIAPMRTFGIYTALGIFTTLILSITFVPAVLRLRPLPGWIEGQGSFERGLVAASQRVRQRRTPALLGLLFACVLGAFFLGRVDNRMDQSTFFSEDSPPDQAQRFLDERFGGSQFLQIQLDGDLSSPEVLRELRQVADEVTLLPHVTQVQHAADVVATVNDAMDGVKRIPDRGNQVGLLYGFLAGRPSVKQLVTDERDGALMHIKIGSNKADALDAVLEGVRQIVATHPTSYTIARGDEGAEKRAQQVALRILSLARSFGATHSVELDSVQAAVESPPQPTVPAGLLQPGLVSFLQSEECFVELTSEQAQAAAAVTVPLGAEPDLDDWATVLMEALLPLTPDLSEEDRLMLVDDLIVATEVPLADLVQRTGASLVADALLQKLVIAPPEGPKGERFREAVAAALLDLDAPTALVSDASDEAASLTWTVSGLPVMYNGLSISVTRNQFTSLGTALMLVLVIMTVLFRSPTAGLLATAPTAITLLIVYGAMGAMGVHLDIGTSMLGSIIIGAGVDYAVHLMAAWKGDSLTEALDHAVLHTGPAIWTNALMVSAGFFILTLGEAKPLQNVGGLTSAAMLVAAVATFVAIPLLARRHDYGTRLTSPSGGLKP